MDVSSGKKHVLDYWEILARRRWVVLLATLSVTLVTLVGSLLATPLYRATAVLMIERQSPDIYTFRDLSKVDYSWIAYSDFYQTQYTLIASDVVARKAATRLGLASHPLFGGEDAEPPSLWARLKAMIPRRKGADVTVEPLDIAAAQVLAGLEVVPVRNSHLVQIGWVGEDPQLAADVANATTEAFVQYNIESQFTVTAQAGDFLINQIGKLRREINESERLLQQYGELKGIVSVDDADNITMKGLVDISQRRTQVQTRLAQAEAAYTAARNASPDALPEVMNSDLIGRLRQEYAEYEAEFSEKSRLFKDDWPGMQTLRSRLEQARERLELETSRISEQVRATAQAHYERALEEVRNLDRLLQQQEGAAQKLKRDAVEYANLRSVVQKKRESLNSLIRRQNEMALSTELKDLEAASTNVRLMERAKAPALPFKPRTRVNVLFGLVLGLALGLVAAFGLDYLDNTISSATQIEGLLGLPTLAEIPRHLAGPATPRARRRGSGTDEPGFDLLPHLDPRARASEAYRELRTAILLSHAGEPPREIMLTSSMPAEGKSATAINLAIVLTQLGRRVLLVDADLRRPRLHRAFRTSAARGLSTYLSGLEAEVVSLAVPTDVDGLELLPSGPVPPNPSELLNGALFARIGSAFLDNGYDHVIYDSPPLLSVPDSLLIAQTIDITILVVRAGQTPRQAVRDAASKLQQAGKRPAGVVLNSVDLDRRSRLGYYGQYAPLGEVTDDRPELETEAPRKTGAGA